MIQSREQPDDTEEERRIPRVAALGLQEEEDLMCNDGVGIREESQELLL